MGIEDKLEQLTKTVNLELGSILGGVSSGMARSMKYSVMSEGKRFRPLLLIISGELFGCPRERALPFACALELIHNYSLIHDDLPAMDDDDFRRGKPSCHKAFSEGTAVLAGDALLTLAFETMTRALLKNFSGQEGLLERGLQVIEEISRAAGAGGMIEGQYLDITAKDKRLAEKEYYRLILKKTGALIVAAVRAGGWLGGADQEDLRILTAYGRNVGLAFQIRDDILDSPRETRSGSNAVFLEGSVPAKKRLNGHVFSANKELEKLSRDTHALQYMALKLLEVK